MNDFFEPSSSLTHVCLGDPSYHLADLRLDAQAAQPTVWTINRRARAGDYAFFYFVRPASKIVAAGKVWSDAYREENPASDWCGSFLAEIGDIRMIDHAQLGIRQLRDLFPSWGWLKTPIRSSVVPQVVARQIREIMKRNFES